MNTDGFKIDIFVRGKFEIMHKLRSSLSALVVREKLTALYPCCFNFLNNILSEVVCRNFLTECNCATRPRILITSSCLPIKWHYKSKYTSDLALSHFSSELIYHVLDHFLTFLTILNMATEDRCPKLRHKPKYKCCTCRFSKIGQYCSGPT